MKIWDRKVFSDWVPTSIHYYNMLFHVVYWINFFYSVSLVFCLYYSLFSNSCGLKKCSEWHLYFLKIELYDIFVTLDTFPTCPRFNSLFSCVISFWSWTLSQLVSFSTCYSLKIKKCRFKEVKRWENVKLTKLLLQNYVLRWGNKLRKCLIRKRLINKKRIRKVSSLRKCLSRPNTKNSSVTAETTA